MNTETHQGDGGSPPYLFFISGGKIGAEAQRDIRDRLLAKGGFSPMVLDVPGVKITAVPLGEPSPDGSTEQCIEAIQAALDKGRPRD